LRLGGSRGKSRLENPLTEAQKTENVVAKVERQRKIQRTAVEKSKRARVDAKIRRDVGVEGLVAEATRKLLCRKSLSHTT